MRTIKDFINSVSTATVLLAITLGVALIGSAVYGATVYPTGSLLQPNDITSSHIRDNTIVNADISQTTAFTLSSATIQTVHTGDLFATSSATLTATTTFGAMAWHMPQTDGTSGQVMTTNGAGGLSLTTISQPYVSTSFTAGESITAGDAVSLGDGSTGSASNANAGGPIDTLSATTWVSGSFTTPASAVESVQSMSFSLYASSAGSKSTTVQIRTDNAGKPSSTVLYTNTSSYTYVTGTPTNISHTLTSPLAVSANTKYWYVVYDPNSTGQISSNEASGTSNKAQKTTDSGSTWAAKANDLANGYVYLVNMSGRAYKASAASANFRFNDFVGFAASSVSVGQSVTVQEYGWLSLFSGLTIGSTYYLNDTQGTIGTSAGSQSLIVGRGITSTTLMTRNP